MAVLGILSLGNVPPSLAPYSAVFPVLPRRNFARARLKLTDLLSLLVRMVRMSVVVVVMPVVVPVLVVKSAPGDKTVTMESVPAVEEGEGGTKTITTTTTTTTITTTIITTTTMGGGGNVV